MKTLSLMCNQCGAPLQVPESVRFVTCSYCKVQLKVHQSAGVAHTEILEQIHAQHEEISGRLATIEKHNAIEQLDREWMIERESLLVSNDNGQRSKPSGVGSLVGGAIVALFGVFWVVQAASMGAPTMMVLFGICFVGVAIVTGLRSYEGAGEYRRRERAYRKRRRELSQVSDHESSAGEPS